MIQRPSGMPRKYWWNLPRELRQRNMRPIVAIWTLAHRRALKPVDAEAWGKTFRILEGQ